MPLHVGSMHSTARKKPSHSSVSHVGENRIGKNKGAELELERVVGITTQSPQALCSIGDLLAYLAGCVVVLYDPVKGSEVGFFRRSEVAGIPKAFSCVAAGQGRYLAAGETGHQPAVQVWDTQNEQCIASLKGHRFGLVAVAFSASGKLLVSAGVEHDAQVCLWDWRAGLPLMRQKVTTAVRSLTCSNNGACFVTTGSGHFNFWSFGGVPGAAPAGWDGGGRGADLAHLGGKEFVSSACTPRRAPDKNATDSPSAVYGVTSEGVLCYVRATRKLEKWVDLQVSRAFAVCASERQVACACAQGVVRVFASHTLKYMGTLPLPAPVGQDLSLHSRAAADSEDYLYPDAIAITFTEDARTLSVVYSDHSLFVWDARDATQAVRLHSFLSHSGCVWDVAALPLAWPWAHASAGDREGGDAAFATCSSDGSVRLWALKDNNNSEEASSKGHPYCREMVGMSTASSEDESPQDGTRSDPPTRASASTLRCLSVSPDGSEVAAGDRGGNVRVYCARSLQLKAFLQAHDAEVLCLDYSSPAQGGPALLASGGRDRLIHVYDARRNFKLLETLADHSSSVTAVRFAEQGAKLISCGADKTVLFRHVSSTRGAPSSRYHGEVAPRGTVYDVDVAPNQKVAVSVGQDKKLNVWSVASGRPTRQHKVEGGEAIVVRVDPSSTLAVCSHADRSVRIYNLNSGALLARATGHAEVVTGVTLTSDGTRLVSVSGDTCVFVWRLPPSLVRTMQACIPQPQPSCPKDSQNPENQGSPNRDATSPPPRSFGDVISANHEVALDKASDWDPGLVGRPTGEPDSSEGAATPADAGVWAWTKAEQGASLPSWAQQNFEVEHGSATPQRPCSAHKGRWAERVGQDGYTLEGAHAVSIRASGLMGQRRKFTVESPEPVNASDNPARGINEDFKDGDEVDDASRLARVAAVHVPVAPGASPDLDAGLTLAGGEGGGDHSAARRLEDGAVSGGNAPRTPDAGNAAESNASLRAVAGSCASSSEVLFIPATVALEETDGVVFDEDEVLYYGSMCGTLDLGQEDEDGDDANASPPRATLPSQKTHQTVDNKNEAARSQQANLDVPDELSDEQVGLQGSLLATFHELDKEPHVVSCDNRLRTSFSATFRRSLSSNPPAPTNRSALMLPDADMAPLTASGGKNKQSRFRRGDTTATDDDDQAGAYIQSNRHASVTPTSPGSPQMADSPVVERPHTLGRTPDPSVSAALQCHEPGSEAHPTQVPLKSSVDAAGTGASADGPACVLFGISPGEEASGVDSGEEPQRTDLDLSALELLTSVDAAEQEALNENVKPNANVNQGVDLVQAGPCVGSPRRHADAQQEGEEDCAQVPVAAEPADSPTGPVANQSSVSTAGRDGALDAREEGGDISDATETDAAATVTGPEEVEEEAVHLVKNDVNFAVKAAAEALPASQHDVQDRSRVSSTAPVSLSVSKWPPVKGRVPPPLPRGPPPSRKKEEDSVVTDLSHPERHTICLVDQQSSRVSKTTACNVKSDPSIELNSFPSEPSTVGTNDNLPPSGSCDHTASTRPPAMANPTEPPFDGMRSLGELSEPSPTEASQVNNDTGIIRGPAESIDQLDSVVSEARQIKSQCATAIVHMANMMQRLVQLQARLGSESSLVDRSQVQAALVEMESLQKGMIAMSAMMVVSEKSSSSAEWVANEMFLKRNVADPVEVSTPLGGCAPEDLDKAVNDFLEPLLERYSAKYAQKIETQILNAVQARVNRAMIEPEREDVNKD